MSDLDQQMEAMWLQVKQATDNIFKRDLSREEFFYLMSCYPYLEICDADYPYIERGTKPEIIDTPNGWRIFDFKSVLVSSASELQQRRRYPRPGAVLPPGLSDDDEDEEGGGGFGTIVNQYAVIADQMVAIAQQKGWAAAEIVSGYYPMQRMAWISSRERNYTLKGFEPGPEDYVVSDWVQRMHNKQLYIPDKTVITTLKPE